LGFVAYAGSASNADAVSTISLIRMAFFASLYRWLRVSLIADIRGRTTRSCSRPAAIRLDMKSAATLKAAGLRRISVQIRVFARQLSQAVEPGNRRRLPGCGRRGMLGGPAPMPVPMGGRI
jgi:hypothetical protein